MKKTITILIGAPILFIFLTVATFGISVFLKEIGSVDIIYIVNILMPIFIAVGLIFLFLVGIPVSILLLITHKK